jgi:hypothetical protein
VKTRLAAAIGAGKAAALYRAFAQDTCRAALRARVDERRLLYTPGPPVPPRIARLLPARLRLRFRFEPQGQGDLGRRLDRAIARALASGFRRVVVIGSDAPLIQPEVIDEAVAALATHDLVLGPARDGGYYLLGLGRRAPSLFSGIPWSTGAVLRRTLGRARRAGLRVKELPALPDVDRLEDLRKLGLALRRPRLRPWSSRPGATIRALLRLPAGLLLVGSSPPR